MSKEDKKESGEVTRREFLKDAGFIVGGAAIGAGIAYPLIPGTETEVPGPTVEVPGPTVQVDVPTFVAPDGTQFATFDELITYLEGLPGGIEVITEFKCPYDDLDFATVTALGAHLDSVHGGQFPAEPGEVVEAIPGAVTLTVNGTSHLVKVDAGWPLSFVIREKLGLVGTKIGCDRAECGACTIIVDGRAALACTILAIEAEGLNITTIEGLADGPNLHPVQQRFLDNNTFQCGYCTPGQIMSAVALLDKIPSPTLDEAKEAISGNLCFCGDYTRIVNTIVQGGA